MTGHDFTACDCRACHVELLLLQDELDEMERTDPDVRAAAESYDAMVRRVTRQPTALPCPDCGRTAARCAAIHDRTGTRCCGDTEETP